MRSRAYSPMHAATGCGETNWQMRLNVFEPQNIWLMFTRHCERCFLRNGQILKFSLNTLDVVVKKKSSQTIWNQHSQWTGLTKDPSVRSNIYCLFLVYYFPGFLTKWTCQRAEVTVELNYLIDRSTKRLHVPSHQKQILACPHNHMRVILPVTRKQTRSSEMRNTLSSAVIFNSQWKLN